MELELADYLDDEQRSDIVEMNNDQDYESMLDFANDILNSDPNHKGAILIKAMCTIALELHEEAVVIYQKARELNIKFDEEDYLNLALSLSRTGRYSEALPEIESALKMPESDENTKKLHEEILRGINGGQTSSFDRVNIRQKFDKQKNAWFIVMQRDDAEDIYEINSITQDEFKPILDLRKQHQAIEESGGTTNLTPEEEDKIYRTWFETVLPIGLKNFTQELLTTLSDDELHALTAQTFARLNSQLESTLPSYEDIRTNFARFSWQQMEDLVGELFTNKGYSTQVGVSSKEGMKRSGDFGIDVRASNDLITIGIQVKHHSSNVDFDTIAKTLGVSQEYDKVLVINTKTGFTPQAVTFANNEKKLELWDSERFNSEIEENFL